MAPIEELQAEQEKFDALRPPKPVTDNILADSLLGVAGGVEGFARETIGLAGSAVDFLGESVGLDVFDDEALDSFSNGTSFGERGTAVGKFVQSTTEFVSGFFPALGAVGRISKLGTFVNSTIAGALVDSIIAEDDQRLSNFAQDLGISNVVTDYLANDGNEGEVESRLKDALEGALAGSVIDGAATLGKWAFGAIKAHKAGRNVITEAVVQAKTAKEAAGEVFDEAAEAEAVAAAGERAEAAVQRTLAQAFHGTRKSDFALEPGRPLWVTKDAAEAESYSGVGAAVPGGQVIELEAATRGLPEVSSYSDLKKIVGSLADELEGQGFPLFQALDDKRTLEALSEKGVRGIKFTTEPSLQAEGKEVTSYLFVDQSELSIKGRRATGTKEVAPPPAPTLTEVGLDVDIETVSKKLPELRKTLATMTGRNPRDLNEAELMVYGLRSQGDLNPEAVRFKEGGAGELLNSMTAVFRDNLKDVPGKAPVRDPEMAARVMKSLAETIGQSPQEIELAFKATNRNLNDIVDQALAGQVVLGMTGDSISRSLESITKGANGDQQLVELAADMTLFVNLMGHIGGIRSNVGRLMRGFQGRFQDFAGLDNLTRENFGDVINDMGGRKALLDNANRINEFIKRANGDAAKGIAQAARGSRPDLAWAMGTEYFIGNLLSGPLTASTNFISSAAFALFRPVEAAAGALGAAAHGAVRGNSERHLREAAKRIRELKTMFSLQDSVRHAARTFFDSFNASETESLFRPGGANLTEGLRSEGSLSAANALRVAVGDDRWARENPELAAKLDWIGKAFRFPGRVLKSTDDAIKTWVARSHATARIWDDVVSEGAADVGAEVASRVDKLFVDGQLLNQESLLKRVRSSMADAGLTGSEYGRELNRRFALAMDEATPDLTLARELQFQAETSTFTRRGVTTNGKQSIDQYLNQLRRNHPWTNLFIPFVTTPLNIVREAGSRAGAGPLAAIGVMRRQFFPDSLSALKEVHGNFIGDLFSNEPERVAEASGKLATSIGMVSLVGSAFIGGRISGGGPKTVSERKILEQAGWKPYSIKIGDKWVSYHRLDPFASHMGIIADFADAFQRSGEDGDAWGEQVLTGVLSGVSRNLTSKTYLKGLSNLVNVIEDPEGNAGRFSGTLAGGFVPLGSLGRNVNRVIDPVDRDLRGLVDQILDRIPGMSSTLPPQRNILGEVVDRPRSLFAGQTGGLTNFILPFAYENVSDNLIKKEMADIGYGFTPPRAAVNGISLHDFKKGDQTAYDRWLELHGEVRLKGVDLKGALRRLITSSNYKRLSADGTLDVPESPRVAEIKRIVNRYRAQAKEQMYREFPDLKSENDRIARERNRLKRGLF